MFGWVSEEQTFEYVDIQMICGQFIDFGGFADTGQIIGAACTY